MNHRILTVTGLLSTTYLLLVDSAVKGVALLVLAAVATVILTRDSAATRYLVWLLAMVAILAVPVLSAMLPEWQVLPVWAGISPETADVSESPPSIATPADVAAARARRMRIPGKSSGHPRRRIHLLPYRRIQGTCG